MASPIVNGTKLVWNSILNSGGYYWMFSDTLFTPAA